MRVKIILASLLICSTALAVPAGTTPSIPQKWGPIPGVSNFDPNNMPHARIGAARQRANLGRFVVMMVGDSTSAGVGAGGGGGTTDGARQKTFAYDAALILAGYGIKTNASAVLSGGQTGNTIYDATMAFGAGWDTTGAISVGGQLYQNTTTTGTALAHTPQNQSNQCDVWYTDTGSSVFTVDLDGAGAIAVTAANTGLLKKQTITGTLAAHTLNIKRTSGTVQIGLIDCYNATTYEVSFWNGGATGSNTNYWKPNTLAWDPTKATTTYNPDVIFFNLGLNDEAIAMPYATYYANMAGMITAFLVNSDVVLIKHHHAQGREVTELVTYQAIDDLAAAFNLPVIDFGLRLGPYATAQANLEMFGTVHCTALGYSDEAAMVAAVLSQF